MSDPRRYKQSLLSGQSDLDPQPFLSINNSRKINKQTNCSHVSCFTCFASRIANPPCQDLFHNCEVEKAPSPRLLKFGCVVL